LLTALVAKALAAIVFAAILFAVTAFAAIIFVAIFDYETSPVSSFDGFPPKEAFQLP
jgi:hypothetical protein